MKAILSATVAVAAVMAGTAAQAQTSPVSAESEEDVATEAPSQDIIVTAQKRAQRLQDVPMSIQAYGSETIALRGVTNIERLTSVTPAVQISKFSNQRPQIYIRGIGTRSLGIGSDQSVGVFVDDFYAGDSSSLLTALTDIERIEVLKGPQGTLYGRNTIAGAISIVTKDPTPTTEASAQISMGNYDLMEAKGSLSGPIAGDTVLGRVSAYATKRRGYMNNTLTGGHGMGLDVAGVRGEIQFEPSTDLSVKLTADYNRDTSDGQMGKNFGPLVLLRNTSRPLPPIDPNPLNNGQNLDPKTNAENYGANMRVEWSGEPFTFLSLTQYRYGHFDNRIEVDASALSIINRKERQKSRNFSQEFRLTSTSGGFASFDDKLDWILGVFYFHQAARSDDIYNLGVDSFPLQANGGIPKNDRLISDFKVNSFAAYGEATLHLADSLSITGGLRYSNDRKGGTNSASTDFPGLPVVASNFSVPVRLRSNSLDPKISLNYKPTEDILAYASYSSGYKSGGFQYLASAASNAGIVFGPERVKYYEAGLKTQWLDRTLTANISGFIGDYKGLQLQRLLGTSVNTENAAAVKLKGIEVETRLAVTPNFSLEANYTYLDNSFVSYDQCVTVSIACAVLDGTPLVRSPKNQFNIGAQYNLPIAKDAELVFRADWSHKDKYLLEAGGFGGFLPATNSYVDTLNPLYVEPSVDLVDLRVTYQAQHWSLSLWGTNVTNKVYAIASAPYLPIPTPLGDIGSSFVKYYAPPRMYGVTLGFKM